MELVAGARLVAVVNGEERETLLGELGGDFWSLERDFVETLLVFEDGEVLIEAFDLVESPDVVMEVAVHEGVLEAVGGEIRKLVVGDRIEMVVGNLAGEDAVALEVFHDDAGIADNLGGAVFGGLLGLSVSVHDVDSVFESRGSDVVEEAGEGLLLVVSEMPDDEGDTDAMSESSDVLLVGVEGAVNETTGRADAVETLHFGGGDVLKQPSGELRGEHFEILADGRGKAGKAAFLAGGDVEHTVAAVPKANLDGRSRSCDFGDAWLGLFGGRLGRSAELFGGGLFGGCSRRVCFGSSFRIGDGDGGFLAGRATVNLDLVLVEPELELVVTT